MKEVDAIDDELEAPLLVKVKQEPVVPSTRRGGFHFLCLSCVMLSSVQFEFVCLFFVVQ